MNGNIISAKEHYDILIDQNNDPVYDAKPLQEYMNKWDGNIFLEELKVNNNCSVLEIGVGTGRLAQKVLEQGCKLFVGVDISPKTIIRANENLKAFTHYDLILGDYFEVEFKQTFDIIYSSLTFFHIENKMAAIEKTWLLLNPNGRFVLSIDKNPCDFLAYGNHKVKLFPDDLQNIISLLKMNGFYIYNIIEIEFANIIVGIKHR